MSLADLFGEQPLSEHEVAWFGSDFDSIQKLADSYKQSQESELFAILGDITQNKKPRNLSQSENYSKYMIDNALSQHVDCMMQVNQMNLLGAGLSDQHHYNYYLETISQGKRYGKWAKLTLDTSEVFINKVIMAYYNINENDALMYRQILGKNNQLNDILKKAKGLVTDEFLKSITKNVKEIKQFKKQALEW